MLDLSLILACYNEEDVFERNVKEIFAVLDCSRFAYEVIFVDDGSSDRTRALIDQVVASRPNARKIFHDVNTGRGGAVRDGLRAAQGKVAGFIDIDLEVQPAYIPTCVLRINEGADIAVALRVYKFYWRSIDRYIASKGYIWLVRRMLGVKLSDTETGYKFFNRERILPILDQVRDTKWFWDTEIMARSVRAGLKVSEIPALFVRRFDKKSSVKIVGDSWEYFVKLREFSREFRP